MPAFLLYFFAIFLLFTGVAKANDEDIDPLCEGHNALDILSAEPSTFIYNCVNVTSGDFIDFSTDLSVPGAESLTIQRFFSSADSHCSTPFRAWKFNHDIYAYHPINHFKSDIILNDTFGAKIPFHEKRNTVDAKMYGVHPDIFEKRITNTASPKSGRYHLKNKTLLRSIDEEELIAKDGSGVEYQFLKPRKKTKVPIRLQRKANGNSLHYSYNLDKDLKNISAFNRSKKLFGRVNFQENEFTSNHVQLIVNSDIGSKVVYDIRNGKKGWKIHSAEATQKPTLKYKYDDKGRLIRKEYPDARFIDVNYDDSIKSVQALKAPAGADASPITLYRFKYTKAHKKKYYLQVDVFDAYNHLTSYHMNKQERLSTIKHFTGTKEHQLHSQELFFWGAPDSLRAGDLLSKAFVDPQNNPIFCRSFTYDYEGNVLTDSLYGNLTGAKATPLKIDAEGRPDPYSGEVLHLHYEYNNRHLISFENHPEFDQNIKYTYYEGTDLLKARFTLEGDAIRIREFFDYDENGALKTHVTDDGSAPEFENQTGVTEIHIKKITTTSSFPMGLPETEETACIDPKTKKRYLLSKKVNRYNNQGLLAQQDIYDNTGDLKYTLEWKYDAHGNVIEETNALGHVITRQFDANDNKIFEQGPGTDLAKFYSYDYMNRLIKMEERGADGIHLSTHYAYDYMGNKVYTRDLHGHESCYIYDDFSRVKKIIKNSGTEERSHDILGNVACSIQPGGAKTVSNYTIRGKPYQIQHPDGSEEKYEYTLKGLVRKKVSRTGSFQIFTHDYQGRVVKEETFATNGDKLHEIRRVYNAFHLLQEIDAKGNATVYKYDAGGRLIRVNKGDACTQYGYDTLGRQALKKEIVSKDKFLATWWEYDLLDRLVSEFVQDESGQFYSKVSYVYDEAGRCIETITLTSSGLAIEKIAYNSHGDPISVTDPLGHTTYTLYNYKENTKEVTDTQGRITVSNYDEDQRLIGQEVRNPLGQTVHKQLFSYNAAGKLISQIDCVHSAAGIHEYKVQWEYNKHNQLVRLTEGVGSLQPKSTQYGYNKNGLIEFKAKPDGQKLHYRYDSLGRLIEQFSSDQSIHYSYTYDVEDRPIVVEDLAAKTRHTRQYDTLNRLVEESFNHGLTVSYTYDPLGRVTELTLPDNSSIRYVYHGPLLLHVIRNEYTHSYTTYDLRGLPLKAILIGQAGNKEAAYDLLGRRTKQKASIVQEELFEHDPSSNLLSRSVQDSLGSSSKHYTYNDLDQLQSEDTSQFTYDSLHNLTTIKGQNATLNHLNQLVGLGDCQFSYDMNGCRTSRISPTGKTEYGYDAKGRLTSVITSDFKTEYQYDETDRRISKIHYINENNVWKESDVEHYFYWGSTEIGSCNGEGLIQELKVLGCGNESVAFELQGEVFAPVYDHAGHVISLLDAKNGAVYETYRYSAFGQEQVFDANSQETTSSINPWRYAGKRTDEETGFVYYGMRYYDPQTCRWLTPDPAGFVDGLNLYAFLLNNPLRYSDLDGRFAIAIPLLSLIFGFEFTVSITTLGAIVNALLVTSLFIAGTQAEGWMNDTAMNQEALAEEEEKAEKKGRRRGKDNEIKGGPPRDKKTGNYLPDEAAEGSPHTTLGDRDSARGSYRQGATFDQDGNFRGRTDHTDHGRGDHPNPHYHPATGPNGTKPGPHPLPDFI